MNFFLRTLPVAAAEKFPEDVWRAWRYVIFKAVGLVL
jgi:hypothetical protein